MNHAIYTSEIKQAEKELAAERAIIRALKRVPDPVKRARILKAVLILKGMEPARV